MGARCLIGTDIPPGRGFYTVYRATMEVTMRSIVRNSLIALALAGSALTFAGPANAAGSVGFFIGTGGVRLEYNTG